MLITEELTEQIELNRERHSVYRDGYRAQAKILQILFPNGIAGTNTEGVAEEDAAELEHTWAQAAMVFMITAKLVRYSICIDNGETHHDSLRDLSVYATMLSRLDKDNAARAEALRKAAITLANAQDGETPLGDRK